MQDDDIWAPDDQDDGNIWRNDVIELFLRPSADSREYYEFEVSARGTLLDLRMPQPEGKNRNVPRYKAFDSGMRAAVTRDGTLDDLRDTDRSWTVECAIPLAAFGEAGASLRPGATWTFCFSRCHYSVRMQKPQYTTSAGPDGFDRIDGYLPLTFAGPTAARPTPPEGLRNGGFELGTDYDTLPDDWQHDGDGDVRMVADDVSSGRRALAITAGPQETGVSQTVAHAPGESPTIYRITAMVKSELMPGTLAHLGMLYYDGDGTYVRQAATRAKLSSQLRTGMLAISGDHDWRRYVAYAYNVAPETRSLKLYFSTNAWGNPDASGRILVDDVQLTTLPRDPTWPLGFQPVRWQSDDPAATAGTALTARAHSPLEYVLPDIPVTELATASDTVAGWGVPGEPAAMTLALTAAEALNDVTVTVSELVTADGGRLAPAEVRHAVYLHRRRHFFTTDYIETPTYLAARAPVNIGASRTQQFWLTLRPPTAATPGRYTGTATVAVGGTAAARLPIVFDVVGAVLDADADASMGFYSYIDLGMWPKRDKTAAGIAARIGQDFADMRAHGMTTTVCFTSDLELSASRNGAGDIVIDWDKSGTFCMLLDGYRDAGFTKPLLLYAQDTVFAAAERVGGKPGSKAFAAAYQGILEAIKSERTRRGWRQIRFVPADESYPYPISAARQAHTQLLAPLFRSAGFDVFQHAINHPTRNGRSQARESWDVADVVLQTFCHPPVTGVAADAWLLQRRRAHAAGKELFYYNPDVTGVHPEATRFAFGIGAWVRQTDGVINWCYREANNFEIYRRQGVHTMTHAYLPGDGHSGGPTTGWEAAREGVRDYRALQTLTQLIDKARVTQNTQAQAVALQAQHFLDTQLAAVRFDTIDTHAALSLPADWPVHEVDADGNTTIGGVFKINNGLALADYDDTARRACEYIAVLQALAPRH
jgi:hypothetical protein